MDSRKPFPGEEYNRESNYIIFDDGDLNRPWNIEALAEVLNRLGVNITEIEAGYSDLVLHFEKK